MSENLLRVCQESLFSGNYSSYEVADRINKKYPTLMKEFNPNDTKAKLGVVTLFKFMKETKNITPLQYMAYELGYALVPLNAISQEAELGHSVVNAYVAKN